jgi:hypothetical protein
VLRQKEWFGQFVSSPSIDAPAPAPDPAVCRPRSPIRATDSPPALCTNAVGAGHVGPARLHAFDRTRRAIASRSYPNRATKRHRAITRQCFRAATVRERKVAEIRKTSTSIFTDNRSVSRHCSYPGTAPRAGDTEAGSPRTTTTKLPAEGTQGRAERPQSVPAPHTSAQSRQLSANPRSRPRRYVHAC